MPRAAGAASQPCRAHPSWALPQGARPLLFLRTGSTWRSLWTALSNPKATSGHSGCRSTQPRTPQGCRCLTAEAAPSSRRPGRTSGPRGFASASALLQPSSSPAGLGRVGREQRRRRAGGRRGTSCQIFTGPKEGTVRARSGGDRKPRGCTLWRRPNKHEARF